MLRSLVSRLRCFAFDLWHGVQTCGNAELESLKVESPNVVHGVRYQPTHPKLIKEALDSLPIDHSRFVFLDYGSGKGRVVLVALQYPFKRILGIEFSSELHGIAVRNVRKFRGKRLCQCVNCIHADAVDFDLPSDPLVIFMFNPFRPPLLKALMKKVSRSLLQNPREAWLIYVTPFHSSLVRYPFALIEQGQYYKLYRASNP